MELLKELIDKGAITLEDITNYLNSKDLVVMPNDYYLDLIESKDNTNN